MTDRLPQRVRLYVFQHFVQHGTAPVVEQVMTEFDLSRDAAGDVLRQLETSRHLALVPGTERILMAFPFSAVASPFRVIAGGTTYYANCAWDAIAFHAMLRQDIRIESFCHHCGQPIRVELRDGHSAHADPPETIVYFARRPTEWWENIVTTCSNTMVFFASPEHRETHGWTDGDGTVSLTPDEVHALGGPIYTDKLKLDYERPSREALVAHFAALGLTGDYWTL